jgi:HAMP domain-containing protein
MNITSTSTSIPSEKNFGFWGDLPLSRKLLISFSVLFFFALVIAFITLSGLNRVTASYEDALAQGIEVRRSSDQMIVRLLQARRAEKNFLLRWQTEGFGTAYTNYVPTFLQEVSAVRKEIGTLTLFAETAATISTGDTTRAQYVADINALTLALNDYVKSFDDIVSAYRKRGFDENTGFQAELRSSASKIETIIFEQAGLEQIEITYLQIRRNEKDYLLRGDQVYIDNINKLVSQMKVEIAATEQLEPTEKDEIVTQLDAYIATFNGLIELDKNIAIYNDKLINSARAIEPLGGNLEALGEQLAADDIKAAQTNSTQTFTFSIITILILLVISTALAITLSRQITRPILSLTDTAKEISGGKFDVQAQVNSSDEVGTLARTFNIMTSRLGQAFADVNRRAAELATVATISTQTATILDPYQMLESAVHLTQRGFGLYHAHVFTYHKDTDELKIVVCGYEEGDEHEGTHGTAHIPVTQEQSLVARAARTRKAVIVNDVRTDPGWLPNPLLPKTRAELAVPMIVGEELLGVLDVQSEHVGAFTRR